MEAIIIGKGLWEMAPVVGVITGSVKSICSLIDSMSSKVGSKASYTDTEVYELIDSLDIRNKLDVYSLLVNEFPGTRSQSVKSSLISLQDVIVDIELQLKNIKNKIDYNKRLWLLSSMRSYSFSKDLKILEKLVAKLDSRIESLKTVTEISKLWNSRLFVSSETTPLSLNYKSYRNNENTHLNGAIAAHGQLTDSTIIASYVVIKKEDIE